MFIGTALFALMSAGITPAGAPGIPLDNLHTPQNISEPETFSAQEFKTAAVWFLPDYQDRRISYSGRVEDEPYPYQPSCGIEYQFTEANCRAPDYVSGQPCQGRYPECKRDIPRACSGYVQNCAAGWQLSSGGRCPYDSSYGTCCNLCQGYDYAEVLEGYTELARCESCSGIRYQIRVNLCEGYSECRYGAAAGARVCYSGSVAKYNSCKACANSCTLASCPKGSDCTYEACSGKYCAVGCAVNYQPKETLWCDGSVSCWVSVAPEQSCIALPDCEELGYTKTLKDCWCKTYLRCPFDQTKYYCAD